MSISLEITVSTFCNFTSSTSQIHQQTFIMYTACKLDILVHPTPLPEDKIQEVKVHRKSKFRFPWRISMLAKPKTPIQMKYQPPPLKVFTVFGPLDRTTEFYSDQISRAPIRLLQVNKDMYQHMGEQYVKNVKHNMELSWNSIYNFYRKRLRAKQLMKLKRKWARLEAKKPKGKELEKIEEWKKEWLGNIATPKKIPEPPEIPKKWKPLEDLTPYLDVLAVPKEYHIEEPIVLGQVNPKALLYTITPNVQKLSELPNRRKRHPSEMIDHWKIKRGTLTAKCTPRIEKLAQPSLSAREARKHEEDKFDPWVISPNALKYKPSARILELAKPLERE